MSSPTTEAPKPETRPKLPEGWRWVRLGEISEVIAGQSPPSATYRKAPEGLPFFQGKADFGERHPVATVWCTSPKKTAEAGDILISVRAPVGPTNIADQRCCIGRGLAAIRVGGLADRDFILWAIRRFEAEIAKRGSGSTFDSLPVDELRNFPIPLPPLETQRRIAAILTEQMGAVEKARKAAEEGLEAARKLTAAHLRAVFESEEAATWKIVTIEEIADTCSGSTPLRSRKDYYNGNIPWVKTGELRDGLIENTEEHVSAVAIAETSLRLLPVNTLLIAMYGQGQTRGRTGLLAVPATTNQACFAILPNPQRFNPAFLQYWFRFSYSRLRSVSEGRGGNQPNLNGEILKAERVPLPTLETQHRIVAELNAKLEATQALIRSLEAQLEAIRALPAAILRRAFSGEL